MKRILASHGLIIELDTHEIFPDDPGAGTPAMVYTSDRRHSATFSCALNEGELDCGEFRLTPAQVRWLESQEPTVDRFFLSVAPWFF